MRRFEKFTDLDTEHDALLKRQRDKGVDSAFLDTVQQFVEQGKASGAMLDSEKDRDGTQTILDYWATRLVSEGRPLPDTTLADFDPTFAPELPDQPCPYRGLSAFTDAQFFYGRDDAVAEVVQKLSSGSSLVAVVGPSGSGKSSVTLGGVLNKLKNRYPDWHYLPSLVPGDRAIIRLNNALEQATYASNNLLVIDQFEELFTLTRDETERRDFASRLVDWLARGNRIVLTLRNDFDVRMPSLGTLYDIFDLGRIDLRPMSGAALRNAIEKPASEVGLRFDVGIVEHISDKVLGVSEGLPLLQFTLLKLWKLRKRNRVTREAYRQLGEDPLQALDKVAEALYQNLTSAQQGIAQRILLQLVTPKEGENEFTRNRVLHRELTAGENAERVNEVLQILLDEGLLRSTGNDAQIEVMHEALVRNWRRLDEWLRKTRASLARRFLVQRRAVQWDKDGRPIETTLSGRELEEAERLENLDALSQAYVVAGLAAQKARNQEREKQREFQLQQALATAQKERRNRQVISVFLVIALLASTIAGGSFWRSQQSLALAEERKVEAETARTLAENRQSEAEEAKILAENKQSEAEEALKRATTAEKIGRSRALAASAQVEAANNDEIGTLIAIEANQTALTTEARAILESLLRQREKSTRLSVNGGLATRYAAWSPDGEQVLTANGHLNTLIWDTTNKRVIYLPDHTFYVTTASWSPTGKQIVIAGWDKTARIRDVSTGEEITQLTGHKDDVNSAAWSPDGKQVLTASSDTSARIWDAGTGKEITLLIGHTDHVIKAVWSPDGKHILTTSIDNTARIWEASTGKEITQLTGHTGRILSTEWSPDGKQVLTASQDNTARIWDASTGKAITKLTDHTDYVTSAVWSPNIKQVLTASNDKTARIWDTSTGKEITTLTGHTGSVLRVAWSPNGKQVLTASEDKTARIWDANTGKEITKLIGHQGQVNDAAWSPDGKRIVTASSDGTARIYYANIEDLIAVIKTYLHRKLTCAERMRYLSEERDCTKEP